MLWKRVSQHKFLKGDHSVRKGKKYSNIRSLIIDEKQKRKFSTSRRLLKIQRNLKRKSSHVSLNRTRDRKKRKMGDVNGVEGVVDTSDRISELPEHIIHHILSLLRGPKDAARSIALSKKWRSIWYSFLSFDFDQKSFEAQRGEQEETFIDFVNKSLLAKFEPMLHIPKLRLGISSLDIELEYGMSDWIRLAVDKNIKELEIHVDMKNNGLYPLPQTVLLSTTITSLKLYGCRLDNYRDIKLFNLKMLSVKNTRVDVDLIQSFVRSCPMIEDLRLIYCDGLEVLHISTLLKLNRVELHECHDLTSVEIKLPNLLSFLFHGKKSNGQCKINLAGCDNLKFLTLKDAYMTDELFQDQISKFPSLEKLLLKECNILKRITVLSRRLKGLTLIRCKNIEEASIDAPNLVTFEYTGNRMPFSSMYIPSLNEAKLNFESIRRGEQYQFVLDEVHKFLRKFDQSKGLKLVVCTDKNVAIYEELREIQLPPFNALKLEITKSSLVSKDRVDSLLRACFPKYLFVASSPSSEFQKFIREKLMDREESPSCCRYYSRKCWRHYLKHIETKFFHGAKNERTCASNPYLMPSTHHTRYKIEWIDTHAVP